MVRIVKPPTPLTLAENERSLFLAGSIEMGRAEAWQESVERELADEPITILNPRRDSWDPSWEQTITNPRFREQVEWELDGLERSTWVAMYFDPATKSPITLLELGLIAASGKVVLGCPPGFWRRGNVEVVCARYGLELHGTLAELIDAIRRTVQS